MDAERSPHTCVCGLGWGDEGKGKVVDLLCPAFEIVVRYNGGANAGHTVCAAGERFAFHLLPTGVLHGGVTNVIGPGVVVDPVTLLSEIDELSARGIDVIGRLKVSERAHLVLAYHKVEDRLSEGAAGESERIGTTARGIGPCYAEKMRRNSAVRVADLVHDDTLHERIRRIVTERKAVFTAMYGEHGELDPEAIMADLEAARRRLQPCVCDTTAFLHQAMDTGRPVLFEGANGMLLDVDHGTYPFVTSSGTGPYSIGAGAGVPPSRVSHVVGVSKAYATRVGSGPFVSELDDEIGARIRKQGNEFGTTTGRPRRCGWFDAVACRYSARISGATDLALLHLDTLSGLDQVGICVAYRRQGRTLAVPPAHAVLLERTEPVVEFLPGWREELRSFRRFEDLPGAAQNYVQRIEALIKVPVSIIGVGPDRAETLVRGRLKQLVGAAESSVTGPS
jgi:adenylosuccinate synthase